MTVVGIDVGGSKIAAGVVDVKTGDVPRELQVPTPVASGGGAVLATCVELADELVPAGAAAVGIGLCEFVDASGTPTSGVTVDWRALDVARAFGELGPVRIESDVRAAALAEARFGDGGRFESFVYVSAGTGVSYCLVLDGEPYVGARGNAIVVGAPPVERVASGLAIARAAGVERAEEVLTDPMLSSIVDDAAAQLGLALATLVNALDPEAVVVGGGLGLIDGFRDRVVAKARAAIEHEETRELPILRATLGARGGVVGAALVAIR
ncbi:MAG: ROK family protein [Gaiellaceae bacterium]